MNTPGTGVIVMDWGGTWIRVAVVDRDGAVVWQDRTPSPKGGTRRQLLDAAEAMLRASVEMARPLQPTALGIAAAGPVDPVSGTIFDPPNLPPLDGVSFKELWEPMFGCPVWAGNDANLAALGEFRFGAGRGARDSGFPTASLVYVTVSTGLGAGVVEQGRLLLGANGMAAEVGHMVIDRSSRAPLCTCGNRGCLEALSSGGGIARIARERVAQSRASGSTLNAMEPESITSEVVFREAAHGDSLSRELVDEAVESLGVGLGNTLHLYNPDLVVLGGGVTVGLVQLDLLPRIKAIMDGHAMSEKHKEFRLVAGTLGDSAGITGAAALAWGNLEQGATPTTGA